MRKSYVDFMLFGVLYISLLTLVIAYLVKGSPAPDSAPAPTPPLPPTKYGIRENRVVVVTKSDVKDVEVTLDDVLEICPFSYKMTSKFMGVKLKATITGDRTLDLIGECSVYSKPGEGHGQRGIFFLAKDVGESTVKVNLVDKDGNVLTNPEGYTATYKVKVVK